MKKTFGFRAVILAGLTIAASACGPTPPSRAQPGETCFGTPVPCGDRAVESCCGNGGASCAYRVSDGKDFPCDGGDCTQAASDVNAYCKG